MIDNILPMNSSVGITAEFGAHGDQAAKQRSHETQGSHGIDDIFDMASSLFCARTHRLTQAAINRWWVKAPLHGKVFLARLKAPEASVSI
jgi:hypothetical protein